jgi:ABC-type lipoprotein release transport system permease subunit
MGSLGAVVRMVGRRSLGHWRLLATLAVGVVLAAALMSSVFLYSDAIRDLGLSHALSTKSPVSRDIHVYTSTGKLLASDYNTRRKTTDALVQRYSGDITTETVHFGTSSSFYLTDPGADVPKADTRPRAQLQFQDRLQDHVKLVAGREPAAATATPPGGAAPTVELLIGKASADALHVQVGQQFDLHPTWRDKAPVLIATVVGIIEPNDPTEAYWAGDGTRFRFDTPNWPTYPFFLDEASLVQGLGATYPDMDSTLELFSLVDVSRINSNNADSIESRLQAMTALLKQNVQDSRVETVIPDTIQSYKDKLFFTRLPLFALMIQIVGIVLFYIVMVASMVVERQTGEIALLKSRGASTWQIVTVFAIEAFFICTAAVIIGPFVAAGAIAVLGLTPPFHDLSNGHPLHVPMSAGAVGMAAFGAYLAFLALIWPAYRACRYSITNYKQEISRPKTQPAFLRYYLDLVVMGVAALAFYQLRQHGSLATDSLFGGLSADPILLATPSLLILVVALVFLRIFPLGLGLVAWITQRMNGAALSVGLTHMVRSPVQHSRLILLLILTTAVGVFAAGFRATLEQGYQDRAAYEAGAEVRIEDVRKPAQLPLAQFDASIGSITGAKDFTAATRQDATYQIASFTWTNIKVLGVQPDFAKYADWRDDFADESLDTLVRRLQQPDQALPPATVIPAGSRTIGVWAMVPIPANGFSIGLRLRQDDGTVLEYRLATSDKVGAGIWSFFVADLTRPIINRPGGVDLGQARTLDDLFVRMAGNPPMVPETDTVFFDALQVSNQALTGPATALSDAIIVENFDDLSRYELLTGVSAAGSPGELTRATASGGRDGSVARLSFIRGRGGVPTVGLRRITDQRPLPVVVNDGFLNVAKKKTGDEFLIYLNSQYLKVRIVGTFSLFPGGFDPAKPTNMFLADLSKLQDAASRTPAGVSTIFPNEAWLNDRGGALTKESLAGAGLNAETVSDRQALLAAQNSDPLVAASWQGILFLSFSAVLLLSALGFITYSGLSAQARSLEFAILRTMGMSGRQIIGVVSFEQCFVIVAGVVAGTLLGFPLSRLMIDSMGISEQGTSALPPLISRIGWQAIITVYTLLGIILASTIAALVLLYSRLAVSRALRMGEL